MKIVIVGAGFTGVQLAKSLINEKNQVSIIDNDEETIRHASNQLDCTALCADGNNLETLESVGIAKADALVCVSSNDEVNMITCSLVDSVYPNILKIARVRNYAYYVNTATAQRKHSNDFGAKHRPLYGIDYMIHPDVEAADAIVKAVENGAIGNVITFDRSELELARVTVFEGSSLDGITLKDIRNKTELKFLVAYVEKSGETSLPSGDTIINADDTLGILATKSDIPDILELCGSQQKALRKVVLIGAGRIGSIVAEKLMPSRSKALSRFLGSKRSQDFVIIDNDDQLTKNCAERFPEARVMCADASDENFLREEGITSFDLAICTTHNHELNMVLAAYLESLGVGQSISLVSSADFVTIADKLGVDVAIPLRDAVVDSIMSHLRGKSVKEIHTVTNGQLEVVECELTNGSKFSGKSLKEIANPGSFLVLMVKKPGLEEYKIVDGNTILQAGDRVVLITDSEKTKKILSNFTGN
ncbi:MAG: Trk system potassium transporter TrkA [Spirochaetia bacterium]|nr:Trk system potassium transporter TrkA [Spirochaetia bacterium]